MIETCEHCGQKLLRIDCRTCDGAGGWWGDVYARSIWHQVWSDCPTCHDHKKEWVCVNTDCPGKRWYPLSARERSVIASIEREEAK